MDDHFYRAKVDRHIFVDFGLLKSLHPNLVCCLLQLESQLGGGSYSEPLANPQVGSPSSHTLMSYFSEIDLHIITLLEGERKVDQPIHQADYFKELSPESLDHTINRFSRLLAPFV